MNTIKITLLCALCVFATSAHAVLYYHIDCEDTVIGIKNFGSIPRPNVQQNNANNCIGNNTTHAFDCVVDRDWDYNLPRIITDTALKGTHSLEFSWPNAPATGEWLGDKIVCGITPHYNRFPEIYTFDETSILKMEKGGYVGFAVYMPTVETAPIRNGPWTLIYQAYEMTNGEDPPPFAIYIDRQGHREHEVDLIFVLRDDPAQRVSQQGVWEHKTTIKRGVWYSFVFYQKPSIDPSAGRLITYMAEGDSLPASTNPDFNKHMLFDYRGKWGYAVGADEPELNSQFNCTVGLYGGEYPAPARVLFDELKYATSYDEANPCAVAASRKPAVAGFDGGHAAEAALVIPGHTVRINGSNFAAPAEVWFGDVKAAAVTVNSAQSITAVVPAEMPVAGLADLTVYCSGWEAKASAQCRIASAPGALKALDNQTVVTGRGVSLLAGCESELAVAYAWEYSADGGATWLNVQGGNYTTLDDGKVLCIQNAGASINNLRFRYAAASEAGVTRGNAITITTIPATLESPAALVADPQGALYVADAARHAIYKIINSATVALLAGTPGVAGMANASGSNAKFDSPSGLVIDPASGLLLVADTNNNMIRTVTATGSAGLLAGNGSAGAGNGAGAQATFNKPAAIATDSAGNIFVADSGNHVIRKITPAGEVDTYAGEAGVSGTENGTGTSARFNAPSGIAVDVAGYLYVADTGNHAIRLVNPDQRVSTFAGAPGVSGTADSIAEASRFNAPKGLFVDGNGVLYVADTGNSMIREIVSGTVRTLAGSSDSALAARGAALQDGIGTSAWFDHPASLVMGDDDGDLMYIADSGNAAIRSINDTDTVRTLKLVTGSAIAPPAPNPGGNGGNGGNDSNGGGGGLSPWFLAALAVLAFCQSRKNPK
jgi:sugar lactone lactonase YvrE